MTGLCVQHGRFALDGGGDCPICRTPPNCTPTFPTTAGDRMTSTTPQVGDRVRATLGESRNEGVVMDVDARLVWVHVDGATCEYTDFATADWSFEILRPLIPDVEGTICSDSHGRPVWKSHDGWWAPGTSNGPWTYDAIWNQYGPLVEMVAKQP